MKPDLWLGLELRHLEALRAIAEEGTFAAAAKRLGYTQSAVSQQIGALEQITGASMLFRVKGRRPLGLTEAGALVLRHGEAIVARVHATQADLHQLAAGTSGPLRIGTYPSVGVRVLPELLPRFKAAWPATGIQLTESNSDSELLSLIERGELDMAFCMLPIEDGPFDALELLNDPWLLLVPAGADSEDQSGDVGPRSLPLLCFRTCPSITAISALLRAREIEPEIVFRSDDNATLQALVAARMGAAFMPCLTIDLDDPRTLAIDVRDMLPPRRVGLAWHRDRNRTGPARAFVDAATDVARELEADFSRRAFTDLRAVRL